MTAPKIRLIVSFVLFLAWLGFLGFLVYERKSIVLLGPQFAVADVIIIADVRADNPTVDVKEVFWCANDADRKLTKLNLPELLSFTVAQGLTAPGRYIIPLRKRDDGAFEVAPVRTGAPRPYSHASLWIGDGGRNPDSVLARLIHYTKEKPGAADDLAAPVVMQYLGSVLLRPEARPVWIQDVEMVRRIPFGDAVALQRELKSLGAEVQLIHVVELRIYPDTEETRRQLTKIVAEKSPQAQR